MVCVHAAPLIAAVTDDHVVRNATMFDDPSPPMGSIVPAMKIGATVPIAIQRALPDEAARKGVGLRMVGKAFLRGPTLPAG